MSNPPKTTLQNYSQLPHLVELLFWFINNDKQVSSISSATIRKLFKEGYRPKTTPNNDPSNLEDSSGNKFDISTTEEWVGLKIWQDLTLVQTVAEQRDVQLLDVAFEAWIDFISKNGKDTLIIYGTIAHKYSLDTDALDLDKELEKIPSKDERETFKKNYLADELTAAEIRILAWIFRELFGKDYKIKE